MDAAYQASKQWGFVFDDPFRAEVSIERTSGPLSAVDMELHLKRAIPTKDFKK